MNIFDIKTDLVKRGVSCEELERSIAFILENGGIDGLLRRNRRFSEYTERNIILFELFDNDLISEEDLTESEIDSLTDIYRKRINRVEKEIVECEGKK